MRKNLKIVYTKIFVESYYGDEEQLNAALKSDWYAVQYAWEMFVDSLCRDSLITMEQYNSWTFPWPKKKV